MTKNGKKQGGIILKKFNKIIGLLLAVAIMLPGMATKVSAAEITPERVYGADRVLTSIEVSKKAYTKSDTVVLAGYAGEVDSLTGTMLAGAKDAPLILTFEDRVSTELAAELVRLDAKNVYILGGENVVGKNVATELAKKYTVKRVSGPNRLETAIAVAKQVKTEAKHVFLAKGYDILADALAIGPVSAKDQKPVLLTRTNALPNETAQAMKDLKVTDVTIVGGESAVSMAVETELKKLYNVTRVSGMNREKTALAIADKYFAGSDKAILANGYAYADALVGGYLGAKVMAPIVLTEKDAITDYNLTFLAKAKTVWVLGGTGAISEKVYNDVKTALNPVVAAKVQSVLATDATTVEVKFSVPVDKSNAQSGKVTIAGITFVDGGKLSSDGKTLTLKTAANAAINVEKATVVVEPVETKSDSTLKTEKYVSLLTYKDELAPSILSVEAKTNATVATSITVKASEPIASNLVKVNGSYATANFNNTDTATISGLSLAVGQTHSIELINLKDLAGNNTVSTSISFTVTVDSASPKATISAKGDKEILVTFDKSMKVASVVAAFGQNAPVKDEALATVKSAAVTAAVSGTNNTQFIITITEPNIFANKDNRTFNVVLPNTIEDALGNKVDATTQKVTLVKDTVKPVATGYNIVKNPDGKVTSLEITFSEGLAAAAANAIATPSVVSSNGVLQANFLGGLVSDAVLSGSTKVVYTAGTPEKLTGKYAFSFNNQLVEDLAETANKSNAFSYTIDFGQGASVTEFTLKSGSLPTADSNNDITVTFNESVKGGAVANSATDPSNYSLGGKPLPQGTIITFTNADQDKAVIVLPNESVQKDDIASIFTVANIKNVAGTKTIKPYVGTVDVKDDVKPVLMSAKALDNKTIELTYSENISAIGIDADVASDFIIKNGSDEFTFASNELFANKVSGFEKKVRITINQGTLALNLSKVTTVETKSSTIIKDASISKNTQKSGVRVNVVNPS